MTRLMGITALKVQQPLGPPQPIRMPVMGNTTNTVNMDNMDSTANMDNTINTVSTISTGNMITHNITRRSPLAQKLKSPQHLLDRHSIPLHSHRHQPMEAQHTIKTKTIMLFRLLRNYRHVKKVLIEFIPAHSFLLIFKAKGCYRLNSLQC